MSEIEIQPECPACGAVGTLIEQDDSSHPIKCTSCGFLTDMDTVIEANSQKVDDIFDDLLEKHLPQFKKK